MWREQRRNKQICPQQNFDMLDVNSNYNKKIFHYAGLQIVVLEQYYFFHAAIFGCQKKIWMCVRFG